MTNSPTPASQKEATRATIEIAPEFVVTSAVAAASKTEQLFWLPLECDRGRWDKLVQAPIGNPSVTGVCPEHSPSSSVPTIRLRRTACTYGPPPVPGRCWSCSPAGNRRSRSTGLRPPSRSATPSRATPATLALRPSRSLQARLLNASSLQAHCSCLVPRRPTTRTSPMGRTFTVEPADAAGNHVQESYTWTVETGSPTAAVSSGPPALTNSRSATFSFSADELSRFECRLDGGELRVQFPGVVPGSRRRWAYVLGADRRRRQCRSSNLPQLADRRATAPETTLGARPKPRRQRCPQASRSRQPSKPRFSASSTPARLSPAVRRRPTHGSDEARTFQVQAVDVAGNVDPTPAVLRYRRGYAEDEEEARHCLRPARARVPRRTVARLASRGSGVLLQRPSLSRQDQGLSAWPTRALSGYARAGRTSGDGNDSHPAPTAGSSGRASAASQKGVTVRF